MARKFYTIFILPHAHPRFRKIHFSKAFLLSVGSILALVLTAGAVAPHLLFKVQAQSEALRRLADENRRLQEENKHFEASLTELGGIVGTIEDRAKKLAKAVGLDRAPAAAPSGGLGARPGAARDGLQAMLDEEMEALRARSHSLDASFDQLDEVLHARERVLASTPTGFPVSGFCSEGYGWRNDPITGEREFHQGMDIVAPGGTMILAPADGVVTSAGRMSGYGKMVQLSHGYGYQTRYGHLSEILVRPGQRVQRGDRLGRVGSTGHSTGPHLHYEVFKAGRAVNPARYLAERPV
jgi:murein DD-endopeptidase MepM/ murein hydrolase activator NlpD